MLVVEVCRQFGWDYYQYFAQPSDFLEMIFAKLEIDGKKADAEEKKMKAAQTTASMRTATKR